MITFLGDGREYVLTEESAWKVRAEDGRYIRECDISPFIANLPGDRIRRTFPVSTLPAVHPRRPMS